MGVRAFSKTRRLTSRASLRSVISEATSGGGPVTQCAMHEGKDSSGPGGLPPLTIERDNEVPPP